MYIFITTTLCLISYIFSTRALIPSAACVCKGSRSVHHHNFSKHYTLSAALGNDYNTAEEDIIIQPINTIHNVNSISTRRRNFLIRLTTTSSSILLSNTQSANAISTANTNDKQLPWNPLNLKGTYWETGSMIYTKPNNSAVEDGDFLSILENTIIALSSSELLDSISEGNYSTTLRLIRGRLISESQIRLSANALLDILPEDDPSIYKSQESFRLFLRYLELLDVEVEMASRMGIPQLGGSGGLLGDDPRIDILTRVGETEDALRVFVKNIKDGLRE